MRKIRISMKKGMSKKYALILVLLVICSTMLTMPVLADGSIVGWGSNNYGQASPPAGIDYTAIAAGAYHGLALKSDGSIVCWGYFRETPPAGNDYIAIAAGGYHNLALKSDGSIVGWGSNDEGEATPPAGNDYTAIAAGPGYSLALKSDGSIVGWGWNKEGQATPPAGNDYTAIAAGYYHGLALKSDGSIVGWGWNKEGQATPPAGNDYTAIAAGGAHSLALKSDGSIVGWGWNNWGQATPPPYNDHTAIAASYDHSLALRNDGSIVGWGEDDNGISTPPAGNDFTAIAAGYWHSLALMTPKITVTSPNGGETWQVGTTHSITWTQKGLSGTNVRIDLYKKNSLFPLPIYYRSIVSSIDATAGTIDWTIPTDIPMGSIYEVRISSLSDPIGMYDFTDNWFTITTPTITVISPNGGGGVPVGEVTGILWSYTGDPGSIVKIELLKGGVLDQVVTPMWLIGSGGTGDYPWDVPANLAIGDDYAIRITSTLNPSITDTSDNVFSVFPWVGPRLINPNGGETWRQGNTYTISWDYYSRSETTNAWIYLWKGDKQVLEITKSAPVGSNHHGSYSWLIPSTIPDGNDYKIRIYTIPGGDSDDSDASFIIAYLALKPLPGYNKPPSDPDHDGINEDLNANGRLDFADVVLYFNQMTWISNNEPIVAFDLNGNSRIDFADIVALFNKI